jgi:putative hydroxymethylpyrimidine transporter CytX
LWGNLGVSLLVVVAGAVLVPALSLPDALIAIAVGCVIGNLMLATAGMIGADARVPGMALMRAPLGQRGSLLPTSFNVLQGIGWTIFELLVIATAAAALSDELFGFRAQWAWTIVFGACALVLALLGPIGFVRRFIRRFAIWAVPLALLYLTWWALDGADLGAIWNAEGEGGLSVWQGADVVVGITVSWVPYAADYTRFSKTRHDAFAGTGLGYLVPDAWLLALGAVLVLSRDLGDPAALPAAVVAGGLAAVVALFALLVTETDEAFANAYSAAVSLQNAFPRAPQELLVFLVTAIATVGALVVDFVSYQSFLLLLGSVFVPLFAVLLADWLAAGAHYSPDDVFGSAAWRPGLVAAWIAGFALYQWLFPTGPAWWVDLVGELDPPDWGVGATVPSFLVSFGVALVVAFLTRREPPAASST